MKDIQYKMFAMNPVSTDESEVVHGYEQNYQLSEQCGSGIGNCLTKRTYWHIS